MSAFLHRQAGALAVRVMPGIAAACRRADAQMIGGLERGRPIGVSANGAALHASAIVTPSLTTLLQRVWHMVVHFTAHRSGFPIVGRDEIPPFSRPGTCGGIASRPTAQCEGAMRDPAMRRPADAILATGERSVNVGAGRHVAFMETCGGSSG